MRNLTIGTPDEVPKAEREGVYAPAKEKLIGDSVANEPKNWRTSGDPKTWAEQWANEILPIAREAHTRVRFEHVHREEKMATFLPKAKHTKSGPVTSIGQPPSSATNCTKPVGAWRSYSKKFCSRVLFQIRQTREAPKKSNSLSFGVL